MLLISGKIDRKFKLLSNPQVYNLSQFIFGATTFRRKFVENLKIKKSAKILDIGCGPSKILEYLDEPVYYGYDTNPHCIKYAKKKYYITDWS